MPTQILGDGGPDGTQLGKRSTYLIAFYGATPVVQQTATTAPSNTAASDRGSQWGYTTSTQADALVLCVRAINTALTNIGIIA